MPRKPRYRSKNGQAYIDIRVRSIQQLFDARDPAPFRERDLDDNFVEYVELSAEEFHFKTPLHLSIYVGETEKPEFNKPIITESIHAHFEYEADLKRRQLSRLFKTGQIFLVMGLLFLFGTLALVHVLPDFYLKEGIIILGWVAMWKPLELLLFDWYPLYNKIKLYRKLSKTSVDLHFEAKTIA